MRPQAAVPACRLLLRMKAMMLARFLASSAPGNIMVVPGAKAWVFVSHRSRFS